MAAIHCQWKSAESVCNGHSLLKKNKTKTKTLWGKCLDCLDTNPTCSSWTWEPPYLGVSDILDFDRLRKRQSWDLLGHSVRFCSVLCHSRSAVQSWASLSAPSTQRCQPIHLLFIRMWSSSLLAQQLSRAQLRPCQQPRALIWGYSCSWSTLGTSCNMYGFIPSAMRIVWNCLGLYASYCK